jgi:hypothetical protein
MKHFVLSILICMASSPRAEPILPGTEVVECHDVLVACDRALSAQREYARALEAELDLVLKQQRETEHSLKKAQDSRDAWYRDPLTMVLIGAIIGIIGVKR